MRPEIRSSSIAPFCIALLVTASSSVSTADSFTPQWSQNPGAFEAHLRRRQEQPIFPPSRRQISLSEFESARARDREALASFKASFERLLAQFSSSPNKIGGSEMDNFRTTIDSLLDEAARVGAPAADMQSDLETLRSTLMEAWFAGLRDAKAIKAIQALRDAQAAYEARARFTHNPRLAQLRLIPAQDIVPTLLTLESAEIELFLLTVDASTRDAVATKAKALVREMRARGENIPGIEERLATLTILGISP